MATSPHVQHRGLPVLQSAERLLDKGVDDREDPRRPRSPAQRAEMMQKTGRRTVPQIFIGEPHVGGCDDLFALDRAAGSTRCSKAT